MAMCEYELCLRSVVMKKYFRVKADFAFTSDLKGLHFANLQNQALIDLLFCLRQILKLGMIRPFLSKALQPPEEQAVINALEVLRQLVRVNRFSTSHIFLLILLLQLHRLIKHSQGGLASYTDILRGSSRVPSPRSPGGGVGDT